MSHRRIFGSHRCAGPVRRAPVAQARAARRPARRGSGGGPGQAARRARAARQATGGRQRRAARRQRRNGRRHSVPAAASRPAAARRAAAGESPPAPAGCRRPRVPGHSVPRLARAARRQRQLTTTQTDAFAKWDGGTIDTLPTAADGFTRLHAAQRLPRRRSGHPTCRSSQRNHQLAATPARCCPKRERVADSRGAARVIRVRLSCRTNQIASMSATRPPVRPGISTSSSTAKTTGACSSCTGPRRQLDDRGHAGGTDPAIRGRVAYAGRQRSAGYLGRDDRDPRPAGPSALGGRGRSRRGIGRLGVGRVRAHRPGAARRCRRARQRRRQAERRTRSPQLLTVELTWISKTGLRGQQHSFDRRSKTTGSPRPWSRGSRSI